jgi:hypothetical protein
LVSIFKIRILSKAIKSTERSGDCLLQELASSWQLASEGS